MTTREIVRLFELLELELVSSLKRNVTRHKEQEKAEGGKNGTPAKWEAWQAAKLRDIRRFRQENQDILGKYSAQIDTETEAMLREQYEEGGSGGFFHSSDEKLRSLVEEMCSNETRVERAALRYADDVYRKTILRTAVAMTAGGMTLQQATDAATKDFLEKGINCVEYSNGRRVNIASYAEMALRACSTRAKLLGEAKQREALGINTVLVSQYGACSDTCLPWQGLVYIDDVFQTYTDPKGGSFGVSTKGGQFLFLSIAIKAGLFHPNCRHTITTFIEGVSKKPKPMDAAKIEKVNKLEAEQRRREREIRKVKRQVAGLTDPAAVKEAKNKLKELQSDLRKFLKEHNDVLRRDPWRERDDGVRLDKPTQEEPAVEPTKTKADTEAKPYKTVENAPVEKPAMEDPAAEPPKKKGNTDINLHKEAEHVEEQPASEPAVRPAKVTAPITGEDVSTEYAEQATPGEGTITQDEGYDASRHTEETVEINENSDIMKETSKDREGPAVHTVTRLDVEKYKCVSENITTDEVIITDERILHIRERHPNDYERYEGYLAEIITNPDYILRANKPDTAFLLKSIAENGENFEMILRLAVQGDKVGYKNSIITFLKVEEKRYKRYLRTKEVLYKSE